MTVRISVAMATFNGAKYLQEQLDSFASQTLLPDELIVCDDNSTDQTLEILERFSQTAPFPVHIYRNESRLGYIANFDRSMKLCTGDVVFLSDQDDYWLPNKIKDICAVFNNNPDAWVVINDAEITDGFLQPTGLTILGQIKSAGLSVDEHNHGCCSAYRRRIQPVLLPIPATSYSHDTWLHQLGLSLGCRKVTKQCLQYYRRHGNNSTGYITSRTSQASPLKLLKRIWSVQNLRLDPRQACESRILQLATCRERLELNYDFLNRNLPTPSILEKNFSHIELLISANMKRKSILMTRFPSRLLEALKFYWSGGYRQFEGFKSLAKDLLR